MYHPPPTREAGNGLHDGTFKLQKGKKKKIVLGSSWLVKANFKWFILSKKQQFQAASEDGKALCLSRKGHSDPEISSGAGRPQAPQSDLDVFSGTGKEAKDGWAETLLPCTGRLLSQCRLNWGWQGILPCVFHSFPLYSGQVCTPTNDLASP